MLSAMLAIGCGSGEESEDNPTPPDDEETQSLVKWPGAPIEIGETRIESRTLRNTTAPEAEADYYVTTLLTVTGKLEIMPGVTVMFAQDAGISTEPDSGFFAKGTAEHPILFTGREKTHGYWQGVAVASNMTNVMSHTTIEFAGSQPIGGLITYFQGGLTVGDSLGNTGKLAITDCTFRDNMGYGTLALNADLEGFARNTFDRAKPRSAYNPQPKASHSHGLGFSISGTER